MTASYDFLNASPVIPVIAIESPEHAIPLAEALVAGGIINLEVTLRTQYGLDAIRQISEHVPAANVGVGTVCSAKEFDAALDAGASFVVSPGQSDELFERALLTDVPFLPGAVTATEVMAAKTAGFSILKFLKKGCLLIFPADIRSEGSRHKVLYSKLQISSKLIFGYSFFIPSLVSSFARKTLDFLFPDFSFPIMLS